MIYFQCSASFLLAPARNYPIRRTGTSIAAAEGVALSPTMAFPPEVFNRYWSGYVAAVPATEDFLGLTLASSKGRKLLEMDPLLNWSRRFFCCLWLTRTAVAWSHDEFRFVFLVDFVVEMRFLSNGGRIKWSGCFGWFQNSRLSCYTKTVSIATRRAQFRIPADSVATR